MALLSLFGKDGDFTLLVGKDSHFIACFIFSGFVLVLLWMFDIVGIGLCNGLNF